MSVYAVRYEFDGMPCFVTGSDGFVKRMTRERAEKVLAEVAGKKPPAAIIPYEDVPTELRSGE